MITISPRPEATLVAAPDVVKPCAISSEGDGLTGRNRGRKVADSDGHHMNGSVVLVANPLQTQKLGEQVLRVIAGRIMNGEIGEERQPPTEQDICAEFGISKTTAREVIGSLVSKVLVGAGQPGTAAVGAGWRRTGLSTGRIRPPPELAPLDRGPDAASDNPRLSGVAGSFPQVRTPTPFRVAMKAPRPRGWSRFARSVVR